MFRRIFLLAVIALAAIPLPAKEPMRATGSAPIATATAADTPQARVIPWADLTLRTSVRADARPAPFPTPGPNGVAPPPPDRPSPGVLAASVRLIARDSARQQLAGQIGRLPASEPPPGERERFNVAQQAGRFPALSEDIATILDRDTTESVRRSDEGNEWLVEVSLPAAPIAKVVLDFGGGFLPEGQIATRLGPQARAAQQARREFESALLKTLLVRKAWKDYTFADWVRASPDNGGLLLMQTLAEARVLRTTATADGTAFEHEAEIDLEPIRARAVRDLRNIERGSARTAKAEKDAARRQAEYLRKNPAPTPAAP